jgi:RNA polymerase sigma-70 factor (ECF subfamily)
MSQAQAQNDLWQEYALQAQKGDQRAYNALLKDIAQFTHGYLIGTLSRKDWAEDIVQDVLVSVHKSLHTYSAERPFRPWLMSIIAFRRTDFLRKHYSSRSHLQTDIESPSFLASHVTNEPLAGEYKDIEAALSKLPVKQRDVFIMTKIQGYSIEEVATQLGMSESAVKVTAHRAQNKLKAGLG